MTSKEEENWQQKVYKVQRQKKNNGNVKMEIK